MKSFTYKALAVAAASVCGSAAIAGSQSVTPTNFALEAITNSTTVTVPSLVLTLGVARTAAQDFTVVIKPVGGATFDSTSCIAGLPLAANGGGLTNLPMVASLKRASSSECAYEIDVNAGGSAAGAVLEFPALRVSAHSLASGSNLSVATGVWELGESARIDNSADLTNTVATASAAVILVADKDELTTADVDHVNGPLFGFLPDTNGVYTPRDDDTASVARARFVIRNNPNNLKIADGTTNYDANNAAHMDSVRLTVTGDFNGAVMTNGAVTGVSVIAYNAGDVNTGAPAVTMTGTTSATFSLLPGNFAAQGSNGSVVVAFTSALNGSLGTSRSFAVSGTVDPDVGANQPLVGSTEWWVWDANATELRSAFFNNDRENGNLTRFFFQNVGSAAVRYTATCYGETGVTPTYGVKKSDFLVAGTTAIWADEICTFSTGKRGSITFVINAPAKSVKGVYQQAVNGTAAGYIPLERPYSGRTY